MASETDIVNRYDFDAVIGPDGEPTAFCIDSSTGAHVLYSDYEALRDRLTRERDAARAEAKAHHLASQVVTIKNTPNQTLCLQWMIHPSSLYGMHRPFLVQALTDRATLLIDRALEELRNREDQQQRDFEKNGQLTEEHIKMLTDQHTTTTGGQGEGGKHEQAKS